MAIDSSTSIKYGTRTVGGSSNTFQLNGPYVIDISFTTFRLVFDVIVVATSYATVKSRSSDLKDDFRLRDKSIVIDYNASAAPGVSTRTWTFGKEIFNTTGSISKTGDRETDRGFSRSYTCVIEGEMPADDNDGLLEFETNLDFESGRQKIVSFRGVYTGRDDGGTPKTATENFDDKFDAKASTELTTIDSAATFELVAESTTKDRTDHLLQFTRQYVELLHNQSAGSLDDTQIRDHRVTFTDLSQHPGDSEFAVFRLRRVICTFDCAIDIDVTTNLQSVFNNKIKAFLKQTFQTNFNPKLFAVEDQRVSYDETTKRLSASITFIYQKAGGSAVIEVAQSIAFRETRNIAYTPLHDQGEFSFEADPGWATLERVASRTVIVLGKEEPQRRIDIKPDGKNPAGLIKGMDKMAAAGKVNLEGWNIVQSTSQVTQQWIGDPETEAQIEVSILSETVIERWNEAPSPRRRKTFRREPQQ